MLSHEAGDLSVLGVYIRCDGLNVLNDPRLKLDRLDQLFVYERQSGRRRRGDLPVNRGVPVEVLDECRIECMLAFEERCHR